MTRFTEEHISNLKFQNHASEKKLLINRKIRIAVIDSGIRKDDPSIRGARSAKRIQDKNCRNFSSSDPKDWDDKVNHGTRVTRLLLKVAPESELFIAKVSDQMTIPKNKLHHIADVSIFMPVLPSLSTVMAYLTCCRPSTGLYSNAKLISSPYPSLFQR